MPIKLLDLDLAERLEVPYVSARYDAVRVLTRLHGIPVGWARVGVAPDELGPAALRRHAVAQLTRPLYNELMKKTWVARPEQTMGGSVGITVVVCSRSRPRLLEGCLSALAVQSYSDYDVLVVDNAPVDDSIEALCKRWGVRRCVESRRGLDWARNRGIEESDSAVIAFTDDDARPDQGWLAAVARAFACTDVDAVTGLVVPYELDTIAQQLFEDDYGGMGKGFVPRLYRRNGRPTTYTINRYGTGCNMAFRRSALERLGGFDTALDAGTATGGGGDHDMLQRVIESGAAIAYRPDVVVRHVHRRTEAELRRQLFDNGRGHCAALWACVRRARRRDRPFVLMEYVRWLRWWIAPRLARTLLRRRGARMPARLILVELAGGILGPLLYRRARRQARNLAAKE